MFDFNAAWARLSVRRKEVADFVRAHNTRQSRMLCENCGGHHEGFMLEDDVWLSVATKDTKLCLDCVEIQLARPLVIEDFTNALVNENIIFGFMLAKRTPARDVIQPWPEPAPLTENLMEFLNEPDDLRNKGA